MPVFTYACEDCGMEAEAFLQYKYNKETKESDLPEVTHCGCEEWLDDDWNHKSGCGSTNVHKCLPRNFGISGESTGTGCDARGYFSASRKEEGKIMEKAGFVAMSDLGGDQWFEEQSYKQRVKLEAQQKKTDQYQAALQSGKSKEEAVSETFTAKEAISGELDKIYDTKIER
jgi:hypothetical protein